MPATLRRLHALLLGGATRTLSLVLATALSFASMPTTALGEAAVEVVAVEAAETTAVADGAPAQPEQARAASASELPADAVEVQGWPPEQQQAPSTTDTADVEEPAAVEPTPSAQASASSPAVAPQAEPAATVTVTVRVIGPDASGAPTRWVDDAPVTVPSDYTAWEASARAFDARHLAYEATDGAWGVFLDAITSPITGTSVAATADWAQYWQFFVGDAPAETGASSTPLADGNTITWYFGPYATELPRLADDGLVSVTLTVVGADVAGEAETWLATTMRRVAAGTTAATLTEEVAASVGLVIDCDPNAAYGWQLDSITSPTNPALTLAYDPATWRYWQLFVNGSSSDLGAGSVTLGDGDAVVWYYSQWGDALPSGAANVEVDPAAPRPSLDADWVAPQQGNVDGGAHVSAATPQASAAAAWVSDLTGDAAYVSASAPVIAGGHIYVAVDGELRMLAAGDGSVFRTAPLASTVGINATIAYADGIIVVPLLDGRVQALTADALTTVWLADPFALASHGSYDPAPGLAIHGAYAYVTNFGALDAGGRATGGRMAAIALATGDVRWVVANAAGGGYYADGITFASGLGVATDDAGRVFSFDLATGAELGSLTVANGAAIRSAPVAAADGSVYACATDGSLYKLGVDASGTITSLASARFGDASVTAPTIVDGRVYVGGATGAAGLLAVLAADTLAPLASVGIAAGEGGSMRVQCAPLVSTTAAGTYVYATTYATPGSVYAWRVGDDAAFALFTPAGGLANFCYYPVVADATGALYYLNDTYSLFKLVAAGAGDDGTASAVELGGTSETGAGLGATTGRGSGGRGAGAVASRGTSGGSATRGNTRRAATAVAGRTAETSARGGAADRPGGKATTRTKARTADGDATKGEAEGSRRVRRDATSDDADDERAVTTTAVDADAAEESADMTTGAANASLPPLAVAGVAGGLTVAGALAWYLRRLVKGQKK